MVPVFDRLMDFFDSEIADICVELFEAIGAQKIYTAQSRVLLSLLENIKRADAGGEVAQRYCERRSRAPALAEITGSTSTRCWQP